MDRRSQLILRRARELFDQAHPDESWPGPTDRTGAKTKAMQAKFLSTAEDQLLKEGAIESVDQS